MVEKETQNDAEEEKLTLKSLNKQFNEFKEEVFKRLPPQPLPPVHGFAVSGDPIDIPTKEAKSSVTFHFHDRFAEPRIFNKEINGEEWLTLANFFHENNIAKIKSRKDV